MIMCPMCDGTGDEYEVMDAEYGAPPRCETCDGHGEIPGLALIHLPNRGSDLVTVEYVYRYLHVARCFMDGWMAYQEPNTWVITPPRYHQLRDYLYGFDADWITACQVALFLDPYADNPWSLYRRHMGYPTNLFFAVI